ncbi:uncharacterized protein EURHEDRAFT_519357 [Aspergillus ruber CBS 135680]|uniref:Methyltransferase n=1 Tax=Aspergillus ruber (strain CBS 135680) TaxID=1388766 RepID=A0A017RZE5_ASPRC|nr:uncharacterized protein EURHEDRAFT_519357 [Aspergillus ruber CBS 135680]EYE90143.1 hypothetical protein EURHEDRAFT_519357 [Aspergillus ruber CBS 135680]
MKSYVTCKEICNLNRLLTTVENLRDQEAKFSTDNSGFAVYQSPAKEKQFTDFIIFDYTIRWREKTSPHAPVQQVHADQTPYAAELRVCRRLPLNKADDLSKGRALFKISRLTLAIIDWRTTAPSDLVKIDLLYPKGAKAGEERAQAPDSEHLTDGYEVRGETYPIAPNEKHRLYYQTDTTPEEAMFIKCFDSRIESMTGTMGIAHGAGHTAFCDPQTSKDAPARQNIEVRCLVFYES